MKPADSLIGIWLVLNLIDFITTIIGFELGGRELNPLINLFANNYLFFGLYKVLIPFGVYIYYLYTNKVKSLIILNAIMIMIIYWNLWHIIGRIIK